jgi:hypothetical protein
MGSPESKPQNTENKKISPTVSFRNILRNK